MQPKNVNLKSRTLAQCLGVIYLIVAILMIGFPENASAQESKVNARLEAVIEQYMDTEIEAMNERLTRQLVTGANQREEQLPIGNRILLADTSEPLSDEEEDE